jgi:hypothetical protein
LAYAGQHRLSNLSDLTMALLLSGVFGRSGLRCALAVALLLPLAGCNSEWIEARQRAEAERTVMPTNHRAEILAMMKTYLNDPTNVRDAFVSEPMLRTLDGASRYMVCVRYNARKSDGSYAGSKDSIVLFRYGRLDHVVDNARGLCRDATYQRFPELERLSR